MAREVMKREGIKFLKKAEEFYEAAMREYQDGRYNASILAASQSIIMSNDALCIFKIGIRASKDHREAEELHVRACAGKENKKDIVSYALDRRSEYAYTESSGSAKEANLLLLKTRRFLGWVKERIG